MTCPSREQFSGMNGGIRDVQWSPTDAVEFAFGTDNGTIQRWDFRQPKGPKQKITAHDQRTCTSIDWHPDGKHLLSASVDKTVKVWDLSIDGRRQKPTFVLTTPYPVHRARWRPPYWSDEYHEKGAYQCTQLATSYDEKHSPIHIWDLRRPYLPFREIHKFNTAPTDMIWHSRDTLWTVGKEGIFQQNDSHLAPKIVSRRNLQALAVSPSGELGAFAQKRPGRPVIRTRITLVTSKVVPRKVVCAAQQMTAWTTASCLLRHSRNPTVVLQATDRQNHSVVPLLQKPLPKSCFLPIRW
jgi:WD40 repeat protein